MEKSKEIPSRYKLLNNPYPLIVVTLGTKLPLDGVLFYLDFWLKGELTKIVKEKIREGNHNEMLLFISNVLRVNKNFLICPFDLFQEVDLEKKLNNIKNMIDDLKIKSFALVVYGVTQSLKSFIEKKFKGYAVELIV